jgi:broad specificity phosphatase PhoE
MPQTVWIARHANRLDFVNPEWFNSAQRRYDPPLSEDGRVQAQQLAQRLKSEPIAHIFASPFLRTIQTAHAVAKVLDLSVKLEAGLGEWHNPEWMSEPPEIHPVEELLQNYPRIDPGYRSRLVPQYPESSETVNERTAKIAQLLVAEFPENLLLVGHGVSVLGTTIGLVGGTPTVNAALCCLVQLVNEENRWNLLLNGDTSHLSKSESVIRFH